jgi:hypothetical protein
MATETQAQRDARARALRTRREKIALVRPAIEAYQKRVGDYGTDRKTLMVDILADLMHFARRHCISLEDALDMARVHFEAEERGEV